MRLVCVGGRGLRSFLERKEPKELPTEKIITHYGNVVRYFFIKNETRGTDEVSASFFLAYFFKKLWLL